MMPATQCRVCGNILSSARIRKEHEILRHRLTFVDGETFSPTPYVMPLAAVAPQNPASQASATPSGGPALTTGPQAQVPVPASTTASSAQITSGPPSMTNVGGQAPTIATSGGHIPSPRSNTVSPTPMSLGTVSVSPTTVSVGSVGTLSSVSTPSNVSSTAPVLFLTPTPMNLRPRLTRAASSSPVTRAHHHQLPARSSSVSPSQPNSPGDTKCRYCLLTLSNRYHLNRHIRNCLFKFDPSVHNISDYCVLTRPRNYEQTSRILQQLTLSDRIKMCRLNKWAIPNIWPLVFPHNVRPIPPILGEMTASRESTNILRGLLRAEPEVPLPRKVILVDTDQHIQSVLPSRYLTPGTTFVTRSRADDIIVSPGIITFF